ncbi:hypothetical protein TNCV_4203801 [Trichonephila clavipes]|nr:hypothetical protein TNCV_4203801 [Trichonephila clavipes]
MNQLITFRQVVFTQNKKILHTKAKSPGAVKDPSSRGADARLMCEGLKISRWRSVDVWRKDGHLICLPHHLRMVQTYKVHYQ